MRKSSSDRSFRSSMTADIRPLLCCKRRSLGFAEWLAGFRQVAQQARRCPAVTVLLMPGSNLIVHVTHADRIGPEEQPAAIARKAEPMQPHHIDVAWPVRLALFQDLARLVHRRKQQPTQDLVVRERTLRDTKAGRDLFDDGGDLRIRMGGAFAFFVTVPASAGLLSVAPHLYQPVGDRLLTEVRVLG